MENYTSVSRTKTVLGTNILGCIAFIILMILFNTSNAAIPFNYQDSTKRYSSRTKTSYTKTNGSSRWRQKTGFSSMDIQYHGDIVLNDTDTDVVSISPGGYLKIKKTTFGNTRAIIIESGASGNLTKEYYEGRKNKGFNEDGQKWLADILLEVIRHTGIGGEARVTRVYKKGGTDAVINEIRQIDSNSGKGRYFRYLLELADSKDHPIIARKIGQIINSNSTRGRLFREYGYKFIQTDEGTKALFEGIRYMTSNSEKGQILRDYINFLGKNKGINLAFFDALSDLTSNSEKGNVLRAVINRVRPDKGLSIQILDATRYFTSNSEIGHVMVALSRVMPRDEAVLDAYKAAARRITSDSEYRRVLEQLNR